MPNLYHRDAPGASPDDAAAANSANGGVPDDRLVGDVAERGGLPESLPGSQRQGRRYRVLLGRAPVIPGRLQHLDLDAAVDCYGAFIVNPPPDGASR